jgi:cob(I)alamin adenosyltransferase
MKKKMIAIAGEIGNLEKKRDKIIESRLEWSEKMAEASNRRAQEPYYHGKYSYHIDHLLENELLVERESLSRIEESISKKKRSLERLSTFSLPEHTGPVGSSEYSTLIG